MQRAAGLFAKSMELLCVLSFAALFSIFMVQIFFRYILNNPLSWTQEISEILYVWIVCIGSVTIVGEREHVTFSLIYDAVKPHVRRILAIIGTGAVALVLLITLYGNIDYIIFTNRLNSPTLRLPMSLVFSAFGVFMVLAIINGAIRIHRLLSANWRQVR